MSAPSHAGPRVPSSDRRLGVRETTRGVAPPIEARYQCGSEPWGEMKYFAGETYKKLLTRDV